MNFVNITKTAAPTPKEVFVTIDARPKTIKVTEVLIQKTKEYIKAKRVYQSKLREFKNSKLPAVPYNSILERVEAQEFTQVGQMKLRLLDK